MRGCLLAVLSRIRPGRGRHHRGELQEDTVVLPRLPPGPDEDDKTRFDLKRNRPYVDPDETNPDFRWLP